MFKKLEDYLEDISHYLGTKKEKEEILSEIESHILEKARQEFDEMTEENIEQVIGAYGSPRRVAEKYMEDDPIIAPALKGHLLRYTLILFALHMGLIVLSSIGKTSIAVIPFFYIPEIDSFQSLFYVPMAFFFDLGLVGTILYFVTRRGREIELPWPKLKLDRQKIKERAEAKPKRLPLFFMLLGYGVLVWLYWHYDTVFFKTIDFQDPRSLLTPAASAWYSPALLALLGIGIAAYALKFFASPVWVDLLRSASQLVVLVIVINRSFEKTFIDFPYLDLSTMAGIVIVIIAVWLAFDFLKSLVILGMKTLGKTERPE